MTRQVSSCAKTRPHHVAKLTWSAASALGPNGGAEAACACCSADACFVISVEQASSTLPGLKFCIIDGHHDRGREGIILQLKELKELIGQGSQKTAFARAIGMAVSGHHCPCCIANNRTGAQVGLLTGSASCSLSLRCLRVSSSMGSPFKRRRSKTNTATSTLTSALLIAVRALVDSSWMRHSTTGGSVPALHMQNKVTGW